MLTGQKSTPHGSVWPTEGEQVLYRPLPPTPTLVDPLDVQISLPYPPRSHLDGLSQVSEFTAVITLPHQKLSNCSDLVLVPQKDPTAYDDDPADGEVPKKTALSSALASVSSKLFRTWIFSAFGPSESRNDPTQQAFTVDFSWFAERHFLPPLGEHTPPAHTSPASTPQHCSFEAVITAFVDDIYERSHHARCGTSDATMRTRAFCELAALRAVVLHGKQPERLLTHHAGADWSYPLEDGVLQISDAISADDEIAPRDMSRVFSSRDAIAHELLSHVINRAKKGRMMPCMWLSLTTEIGVYPDVLLRRKLVGNYRLSIADSALATIDAFALQIGLKTLESSARDRRLVANQMLFRLASSSFFEGLCIEKLLGVSQGKALKVAAPLLLADSSDTSIEDIEVVVRKRLGELRVNEIPSPPSGLAVDPSFAPRGPVSNHGYQAIDEEEERSQWWSVRLSKDYDGILEFAAADGGWRPEESERFEGDVGKILSNVADDVWAACNKREGRIVGEVLPCVVDGVLLLIVLGKIFLERASDVTEMTYACEDGTVVHIEGEKGSQVCAEHGEILYPRLDPTSWRGADDVAIYLLSAVTTPVHGAVTDGVFAGEGDACSGWSRLHHLLKVEELAVLVNELIYNLFVGEMVLGGVCTMNEAVVSLRLLSRNAIAFDGNSRRFVEARDGLEKLAGEYEDFSGEMGLNTLPVRNTIQPAGCSAAGLEMAAPDVLLRTVDGIILKPLSGQQPAQLEFSTELSFDFAGEKYRALVKDGKLVLQPNGIGRRISAKFKKKKLGLTVLKIGAAYEDGGTRKQWQGQEAYQRLSDMAASSDAVRDWLWGCILGGCINWHSGSCTGMWPSDAKTALAGVVPNRPMPMGLLAKLDVVSDGSQVLVLPFEGSHFFKLSAGKLGLYIAEEIVDETELDVSGYKKYRVEAVQNVG